MTQSAEASAEAHKGEHHVVVSITIDGKPHEIRPGEHPVAQIRAIGHVPHDYDLEQVVSGKFIPLPDHGKIQIKGGEVFVSHPKDAASS